MTKSQKTDYEVCPTPLIDVTQSLRIACTFALDGTSVSDTPVVYMIGMPYATGPITFDANDELYLMRLLSLMPPIAERPFFQEGFLVGSEFPRRDLVRLSESDLACRLVFKFQLAGDKKGWEQELGKIDRSTVYPKDAFSEISERIRSKLVNDGLLPSEDRYAMCSDFRKGSLNELFPFIIFLNETR
ncbi:hypothetical protein [Adlercreutzia sp. ZJ138]|uniref:hypothetical protein n=1 Tax=Adlercreutzia sp. ZJ138 TaxID=2709405 RepID=UPI0013ECD45D|nr:hypothetical protein [Adlercreutzia sp. ZJ138]